MLVTTEINRKISPYQQLSATFEEIAQRLYNSTQDEKIRQLNYDVIEGVMQMTNSFIYIFDMNLGYVYVSQTIKKVLGYEASDVNLEFVMQVTHPNEVFFVVKMVQFYNEYFYTLDKDERKGVYIATCHRVRKADGEYAYMLFKGIPLQVNEDGAILNIVFMGTDISAYRKQKEDQVLGTIVSPNKKNLIFTQDKEGQFVQNNDFISQRELEIIDLLAKNHSSKDIAKHLEISAHTVDTHRRNLLEKMSVRDTLSAVIYAQLLNLI